MGQSRTGGAAASLAVAAQGATRDPSTDAGFLPGAVQGEFFICDFLAPPPKDDMASMEHPLFTLATRPDRRVLRYAHGAATIEVTPSVKGLPTIHDKDVLIYCISQLMAAVNAGRPVSPILRLKAHDLLLATNRETSGDGYRRLREALERLSGARVTTNLATGGVEATRGFGLIDAWEILRAARGGRMILVTVTLSDWIFRSVLSKSVLTLSRDYFLLRKPLERRVYEIARKHCGRQAEWRVGLETLQRKAGSTSPRRVFRKMIREIVEADGLPDYALALEPGDLVAVRARRRLPAGAAGQGAFGGPALGPAAHARAREAAPGYDPAWLEAEWRGFWVASGRPALRDAEAAFLAFARARAARVPRP
jgi:plasmid replication initiation protein